MAEDQVTLKVEFEDVGRKAPGESYEIPFDPYSRATELRRRQYRRVEEQTRDQQLSDQQAEEMRAYNQPLPFDYIAERERRSVQQRAIDEAHANYERSSRRTRAWGRMMGEMAEYDPDQFPDFGARRALPVLAEAVEPERMSGPDSVRNIMNAAARRGYTHAKQARSFLGMAIAGARGAVEGAVMQGVSEAAAGSLSAGGVAIMGAASAAVAGLAAAATAATAALLEIPKLGDVNPDVAAALALREVEQTLGRIRRGNYYGREAASFISAGTEFTESLKDFGATILKSFMPLIQDGLQIMSSVLEILSVMYEFWQKIPQAKLIALLFDVSQKAMEAAEEWLREISGRNAREAAAYAAEMAEIFDFFNPENIMDYVPRAARGV